ncbi:uncharacterized protein LOC106639237 [Copidosoma floridanum]|uniref:uncharacterized protein LOC106639237 n=1 Tax=Copidosoma floridanum TaxID=29053 RepID=UPI0006C9DBA4|nr:uncharacterized protein LOC106639237 [Copidosoma floridanum]
MIWGGKRVETLSAKEWKGFTAEVLKIHEDNERLARNLEEREKVAAARDLANLAGGNSQRTVETIVKGTIGSLPEFSIEENWSLWFERFEQYCVANKVNANKQVSLFLTLLEKEAYGLLRNLCAPRLPAELSLRELATTMKNHLQPTPCVIMKRYKFKECRQRQDQGVKSFVAELKSLSTFCEFETLENSLRNQFVWGLACDATKKRLLGEKDLSFNKAVEIAQALEAASRDVAGMRLSSTAGEPIKHVVDKKKTKGHRKEEKQRAAGTCYCCGKSNHQKAACRYKDFKCNNCGKAGHLRVMCRRKGESSANQASKQKQGQAKRSTDSQHFVEEDPNTSSESVFCVAE